MEKKYYEDKVAAILPELTELAERFGRKMAEAMSCIAAANKPSPTKYPNNGQAFEPGGIHPLDRRPYGRTTNLGLMEIEEAGPEFVLPRNYGEWRKSQFGKYGSIMSCFGEEFLAEQAARRPFGSRHDVAWPGPERVSVWFHEETELWGLLVNGQQWAHGSDMAIRGADSGWHIEKTGSAYQRALIIAKDARDAIMRLPVPAIVAKREQEYQAKMAEREVSGDGSGVALPPIQANPTERVSGPEFLFLHEFGKLCYNNLGRVYYSALSDNWIVELQSVGIIAQGCTNRALAGAWLRFTEGQDGAPKEVIPDILHEARLYIQSRGEAMLAEWMENSPAK